MTKKTQADADKKPERIVLRGADFDAVKGAVTHYNEERKKACAVLDEAKQRVKAIQRAAHDNLWGLLKAKFPQTSEKGFILDTEYEDQGFYVLKEDEDCPSCDDLAGALGQLFKKAG